MKPWSKLRGKLTYSKGWSVFVTGVCAEDPKLSLRCWFYGAQIVSLPSELCIIPANDMFIFTIDVPTLWSVGPITCQRQLCLVCIPVRDEITISYSRHCSIDKIKSLSLPLSLLRFIFTFYSFFSPCSCVGWSLCIMSTKSYSVKMSSPGSSLVVSIGLFCPQSVDIDATFHWARDQIIMESQSEA